jgi:hypothetical protein
MDALCRRLVQIIGLMVHELKDQCPPKLLLPLHQLLKALTELGY